MKILNLIEELLSKLRNKNDFILLELLFVRHFFSGKYKKSVWIDFWPVLLLILKTDQKSCST